MNVDKQTRGYYVPGAKLEFLCSSAMAVYLEGRFRMFPADGESADTIHFDFQAVMDPCEHVVERPQGDGKPFYEMPNGEACYFREIDEAYLSFGDGLRALCKFRSGRVLLSLVESEPRNLFVASHLALTILLVEILKRRGWYSLHAAGFSENGRAILIPGTSGVGKSTLSVALLRAKFDYLTDDMVFLRQSSDGVVARGLIEDVDVSDQTIRFFPELDFLLQASKISGFPKKQVHVEEVYGTRIVAEAYPRAIVLPRISGKETSVITQIGSDEALLEIVPNVLLTEARACQGHLSVLAELVKQTACYRLDTGKDFDRIPALLRGLLSCDHEAIYA
ncbi:MAG: hypothetical protein WA369_04210 [Candidatus Acidiferrales bacterium]